MPKQIYLGERNGGPREVSDDCPDCGEIMNRGLQRGDLVPFICPACGYRCQRTNTLLHDQDAGGEGISRDSFLGIGGDTLRKLLVLCSVLLLPFVGCQGPLHEQRIQVLEDSLAVTRTELIMLREEVRRGGPRKGPQRHRLPDRRERSDQWFVIDARDSLLTRAKTCATLVKSVSGP